VRRAHEGDSVARLEIRDLTCTIRLGNLPLIQFLFIVSFIILLLVVLVWLD